MKYKRQIYLFLWWNRMGCHRFNPAVVGGFSSAGVDVNYYYYDNANNGVGGVRKFPIFSR